MTVESVLEKEFSNLDLTKVGALQQKRTLAFVNHFVVNTVKFLNSFMRNCELKLMQFERRLENINASVVLLEDRLSSIPEVNNIVPTSTPSANPTEVTPASDLTPVPPAASEPSNTDVPLTETTEDESKNKQSHPEYDRFVKMVHVGVPLQAVKLKVALEGLDPDVLENILK